MIRRMKLRVKYVLIAKSLLLTYILSVTFAVGMFASFVFYLYPKYYDYVNDVYRGRSTETANELSSAFIGPNNFTLDPFPADLASSMKRVVSYGKISRIKIFNVDGRCIYSTRDADIGSVHEGDDFEKVLATGKSYSEIIKKKGLSLEGEVVSSDVSETYVPVFIDGKVVLIFEVYSDVTHEQESINGLANTSLISMGLLLTFGLMLFTYLVSRLALAERKRSKLEKILKRKNSSLKACVCYQKDEIEIEHQIAVKALATLAEYNDIDTGNHLNRIKYYVIALATELYNRGEYACFINNEQVMVEDLGVASLLHDIGKVAVPSDILSKPGRLTSEEFEMMQKHAVVAGEVLGRANALYRAQFNKDGYLTLAQEIALYHHERWDGTGYPAGMSGVDIPLSARIVAIADVYDALRSSRPYKGPWTHEKAVREIVSGRGSQFDPKIVDAFESINKEFDEISRR